MIRLVSKQVSGEVSKLDKVKEISVTENVQLLAGHWGVGGSSNVGSRLFLLNRIVSVKLANNQSTCENYE